MADSAPAPAALGESLTDGAATAVANAAESAGADELLRLVRMLWLCDGFTVPHPRLVAALLTRAEALLEGEALEEVKQLLIAATVPHNTRYSPAAADKTLVARLDQARQLAQDMTLPAPARTTFSETASTIKAVMDEEARQWRDDED